MRRSWTEKEVNCLKENYAKLSVSEIARALQRSESAVHHKAFKLGLRKPYAPTYSTCLNCGKTFRVPPRDLKRGGGKYCSKKCAAEGRKVKFSEQEARILFQKWKNSRIPLDVFARKHGHDFRIFACTFKTYFPDEYEIELESRKNTNRRYLKGRRFEYVVRDHLKAKGYFVLRSPRSLGVVDLVALKKGEVLFIQCKIRGNMSSTEKAELISLASSVGAKALVACKGEYWNRKDYIYFRELSAEIAEKM
jgi:Holliday junction resolvase